MQGARTQQQFRKDGMYAPIMKAAGTMGSYGDAQSTQQFKKQGMYSQINAAMGTQQPGAMNGYGYGDAMRGPMETSTQAGVRDHGMYSQLFNAVGKQQHSAMNGLGAGDAMHGPLETRSPAGFVQHGMYDNLYNKNLRGRGGLGDAMRGPMETSTQAGVRQHGMYSHLFKAVGKQQPSAMNGLGAGDAMHGPLETRSPAGFVQHGMYDNLYNKNLRGRNKSLAGYLGQAVSTTIPGVALVLAIVVIYYLFSRKPEPLGASEEKQTEHAETSEAPMAGSLYY